MNHEMNNQAIEGSRTFSTMVSNKVPATARCLSNGIHEDRERERMGSDRERILQQRDYRLCLDFKTMIGRKYPIIKVIRKSKHLHPD